MLLKIQEAILKGDYLKAAQYCQQGLAEAPAPPLVSLFANANDLLKALERIPLSGKDDLRIWNLIQDHDPLVKGHLSCVPDEDLVAALADPKAALSDFDDDDLWDAMTSSGQEKKAREFIREDVDVSGLRNLLRALEG